MKHKEREQTQKQIEDAIHGILGEHLHSVSFCYYQGGRDVIVSYEDFKTESEVKGEIRKLLNGKWRVVVERTYSNESIINAMLGIYQANRVAIVDLKNGELKPYTARCYVNNLLSQKCFS